MVCLAVRAKGTKTASMLYSNYSLYSRGISSNRPKYTGPAGTGPEGCGHNDEGAAGNRQADPEVFHRHRQAKPQQAAGNQIYSHGIMILQSRVDQPADKSPVKVESPIRRAHPGQGHPQPGHEKPGKIFCRSFISLET